MVSTVLLQESERRQTPALFLDQWLHSASVRYLPDNITDCTNAIDTFAGEEPAVVNIGWEEVRNMKLGLKYSSDGFG